jgi:YVTN family beta-propeller protein
MNKQFLVSALLSLVVSSTAIAQPKSGYKIVNHIKLEGDGGWDYITIDEASAMLYVSHGTMVQVVDTKTGKQVGMIPDTKGVHGIAMDGSSGKGYISCGRDSSVVIFDTKTYKTINKVKVNGANPDAIMYDPFSKNIFVFNGRTNNVSVLDTKTDKEIATISVEGKPEFSVSDEKGNVYVNIEDKSKLCQIDSRSLKVKNCWSVAPAEEPSGLAIDNEKHRLFAVCDQKMVVMDASNGKVIATLPIGDRVDGVVYDPGLKRAYSANGDGTMTVVAEEGKSYKVLETVTTQKGARTIAVDTKTHHLYLPTASFGETPAPTADKPHPRPTVKSDSFEVLDIAPAE